MNNNGNSSRFRNSEDQFAGLVDEFERYGLFDAMPVAAPLLAAHAINPTDPQGKAAIEEFLAPYRFMHAVCPDPWGPTPRPGELDGPYRVAHVAGDPDNWFGLTVEDLQLPILVLGEPGFGKTSFVVNLLLALLEKANAA